jgi:hypothetical protein
MWPIFRLIESANAGDGLRFEVIVVKAGTSLNNNSYPANVLREAVPLFNGVRVIDKSDLDHLQGKGKAASNIIGRLVEARFDEEKNAVVAIFEAFESAPVVQRIAEAVRRKMDDVFGLSIDAKAQTRNVGGVREVMRFKKVDSLDLVVDAAAGGSFVRLTEAVEENVMRNKMVAALVAAGKNKADVEGLDDERLLEAYDALRDAAKKGESVREAAGGATPITEADITRLVEARAARSYVRTALAVAQLPQQAKDKLANQLEGLTNLTEAIVDTAIKDEQVYLGHFVEAGKINLPRIEAGKTHGEKAKDGLDDFFTGKADSIREAYIEFTGDTHVTGRLEKCNLSRMAEAIGAVREAVSSGTFASALGDSITRQMQNAYSTNPLFADWEHLCDIVPVRDFRTQERIQIGGYGNLPTVAQDGAYTALTTPGEHKATYAPTKRGGTETISLEAIANDDVGLIRRIPLELANAAGMTLYDFVYGFMLGNGVIYDTVALFAAGHNNIGSAALANASFSAARLALKAHIKPGTGKRIGLVARHLHVPPELEETAYDMFVRGSNNDESFVQSRKPIVHVVESATDANNWYLTADKSQIALLEVGFYGSRTPELFVQDNPTQGSLFSNDQLKYKIRHIYGGCVKDYRGFYGAIVA